MPLDPLRERCRQVAQRTLAAQGWRLASGDEAEFVEAVLRRARERVAANPAEATDAALAWAARNVYSRLLYEAYKQDGSDRQLRAMAEVKLFVLERLRLIAEGDERLANDCADDAVGQAWLRWGQVRDPGRFLGFVLRIGVNFVLAARQAGHSPLDDAPAAGSGARALEHMVETDDLLRRLEEVVRGCLKRPEEVRLVMEHVVRARPYQELARAWGVRAASLHLLKFRALKKLRQCQAFLELEREWRSGRGE